MDKVKLANKLIKEGRHNLRRYLEEFPENYPRIGIPFSKKTMKIVKENLDFFVEEGKKKNVKLECAKDNTNYIFFEYIFIAKSTKKS